MLKAIGSKTNLSDSDITAYYQLVSDLLNNEVVLKMNEYNHHGRTTCFQHCLNVSYYNYKICRLLSLDERAGARAGLLHDLFLYDWHTYKRGKGERLHGFTHAYTSLSNVKDNFEINKLEEDIIAKHMFPLNLLSFPKYRESFVIVLVDKYCGLAEVIDYQAYKIINICRKMSFLRRKKIIAESN